MPLLWQICLSVGVVFHIRKFEITGTPSIQEVVSPLPSGAPYLQVIRSS